MFPESAIPLFQFFPFAGGAIASPAGLPVLGAVVPFPAILTFYRALPACLAGLGASLALTAGLAVVWASVAFPTIFSVDGAPSARFLVCRATPWTLLSVLLAGVDIRDKKEKHMKGKYISWGEYMKSTFDYKSPPGQNSDQPGFKLLFLNETSVKFFIFVLRIKELKYIFQGLFCATLFRSGTWALPWTWKSLRARGAWRGMYPQDQSMCSNFYSITHFYSSLLITHSRLVERYPNSG